MEWILKVSENIIQFVTAACNGDTDAMAKLYSKTLKASYFLASTLCGNKQEAAEITKKAYARAFCNIDKLKKPEAFEIWMKQNVAAAYRESHKFVFSDADAGAVENSAEFLPETVLMSDELSKKVIDAVTALRPELKTALVLYYNNGMPVQVLAKFLGVSESTANALLGKARSSVLATSGVVSSSESAEGALPVITRLFQQKAAEAAIDNSDVRDIFVFAIEAYMAAKPVKPAEEAPDESEPSEAQQPEEKEQASVEQDIQPEEPSEAKEKAVTEVESETAAQEEKTNDEQAEKEPDEDQLPDNVVMFKQRISSILDGQQSEPASDDISSVSSEPDFMQNEEDDTELPVNPVSSGVTDSELEEFGGISVSKPKQEETSDIPKPIPYDTPKKKTPEKKKGNIKLEPKMIIIAAVAAVAVIALAIFGIVKLTGGSGSGDAQGETDYSWVAGGFSECVEIGYLDEESAYFKSVTTGKYGLMDYQGNVILQPNYDGFVRCSSGREYDDSDSYHSLVILGNERYELTNVNGKVSISANAHLSHSISTAELEDTSYEERDRYFEGYAAARKNDKWGYVSQEKDKKVIPYEYEAVNDLADGETSACDYCRPVTAEGLIPVKKDGKMGIINLDNDVVVPFEYSNIMPGSNGVFIACKDGIWGVILTGDAMTNFSGVKFSVETLPADVSSVDDANALGKYEVTSEDGVNVREGVGTDYDVIGEIDFGDVVIGYETDTADNGKKWIKIKLNGEYGWVSMSNLEPVE
ncbi:MAG: WG repeat-containing protein [Clostridia bacterium]|nr:WG repeat-containing protein [Clostridia bacterium]